MNFAKLIMAVAALVLTFCGPAAQAQTTVRLLIGFSGVVDTIARVYAEKLAEGIGRPVVVEIRGDKVRLGIDAPKEITVHRQEVYEAIKREHDQANGISAVDAEK